jgi:predicted O-methyltransferase YrrM
MDQEKWASVDRYIEHRLVPSDQVLEAALAANSAAGLPAIDVSPTQGKLLHLLAWIQQPRRILEIGTLGGYSTIWLARGLAPEGRMVTLEVDPKHAEVARTNLVRAGLADAVEIRVGPAAASLARLHEESAGPFDVIFIDADKPSNPVYLAWALKLSTLGSLIVVDNIVREGAIIDAASADPAVQGVRAMFAMLAAEPRLSATVVQTVGSKGYDGFMMALVVSE